MSGEVDKQSDSMWPIYRRLLAYAAPYKAAFSVAIIAMLVSAVGEGATAWLMKPLLDEGFVDRDPQIIALIPVAGVARLREFRCDLFYQLDCAKRDQDVAPAGL